MTESIYQKQLISLQKTLAFLGVDFEIEEVRGKDLALFPCKAIKTEVYVHGYPSGFFMATNSEGFCFYQADELRKNQQGYDFKEYLVIANVACDPIVINKEGLISWSPHGGAWDFRKMANNMAQFFLMIETFALLYFGKYQAHIYDENFNLIAERYNRIRDKLNQITKSDTMADEFLKCILYQ